MFYEPGRTPHGLPYDPIKACVVPRPIGWISTMGLTGVCNLAPFSQFQSLAFDPPHVMLAMGEHKWGPRKDTVTNIEQAGEFVWNVATYDLREAVIASGREVGPDVDEFDLAGVTKRPARVVKAPMVAESPIHFECVHVETVRLARGKLGDSGLIDLVIGRVVAVHIADEVLDDRGRLDVARIRPLARMGYYDYTAITETFEMRDRADGETVVADRKGS